MMNNILNYLEELFPNPVCELHYQKDYELLMAVMLSAQTTDKRVNMVTAILFSTYPNLKAMEEAPIEEIINIIRPIGTYTKKANNLKEIAHRLLEIGGKVPNDRAFLESLSGVGRKTANVVLSNLFQEPCLAVDTHVTRVSKRLNLAQEEDDVLTIEKKLTQLFPEEKLGKLHHQLVLFGRYHCKAANPACSECKIKELCRYEKKKK